MVILSSFNALLLRSGKTGYTRKTDVWKKNFKPAVHAFSLESKPHLFLQIDN